MAVKFESQVCDMVQTDRNLVLRKMVSSVPKTKRNRLVDLGCGIGTFIQRFGDLFGEIVGVDFSRKMISRAKKRCSEFSNVSWVVADVQNAATKLGTCADLTVCLNVITSIDLQRRKAQWTSLRKITKKGGFVIVGLPSVESAKFVDEIETEETGSGGLVQDDGLVKRGKAMQKFFTREEIHEAMTNRGFEVQSIRKVHYSWEEESLPELSGKIEKLPWDWACLVRRVA